MPKRRAVLMTRQAISPRLAIRIRLNMPRWTPRARRLAFAAEQRKCQQPLIPPKFGFPSRNRRLAPRAPGRVLGADGIAQRCRRTWRQRVPIALQSYMKLRGWRRVRTWLAIHARTYASTSDERRTLAHGTFCQLAQSRACASRPANRTTIGDRLIAASSAPRPAPADGSEPVVIDALPSRCGDL